LIDSDIRLNAIKNIIKKSNKIYYNDVIYFLNKYLNGEIKPYSELNNYIISKELGISKNKASKILSNLEKLEIVKRLGYNKYLLITFKEFRELVQTWVENSINKDVDAFNYVCETNYNLSFYENFSLESGYRNFRNIFKNISSEIDILQENGFSELLCNRKWDDLSPVQQEIFGLIFPKSIYEIYYNTYNILRKRLVLMGSNNENTGRIYRIICLKKVLNIFNSDLYMSRFSKKKIRDFLITYFNNLKNEIILLKKYFEMNKLLLIIDINNEKYNGPISIMGQHIFQIFHSDSRIAANVSILHINNKNLAEKLKVIYLKLFDSLFRNMAIKYNLPIVSNLIKKKEFEIDYGKYLFNLTIKVLNKLILNIKQI